MKGNIVIKVGGSLLFTEDYKINSSRIAEFCNILKTKKLKETIVIICGGGLPARHYIDSVRSFHGSEALCDTFGIELSRINAKLVIACLHEYAYPQVPKSLEELSIALLFKKIIVMGGLQPGQSTNAVAALAAELICADMFINATDVDGIYEDDPKTNPDAKMYDEIKIMDLFGMITKKRSIAGSYKLFDLVAVNLIARSEITTWFVNGKDPKNIFR